MTRKLWRVFTAILVSAIFFSFVVAKGSKQGQADNQPPMVRIINPKNNSQFDWDTPVHYEITVADKEDGNSKYDEINAKEVLLEVRYVANKVTAQAMLSKGIQNDMPGLAIMRSSNCFNCHNFNSKALGPSFDEIGAKYTATKANIDTLVKRISKGSAGVWGKDPMPTHPELNAVETKSIVQWIFKVAKDKTVSYYIGLTGSFHVQIPVNPGKGSTVIAIASYIDHGIKNAAAKHLKGQDVVVLSGK